MAERQNGTHEAARRVVETRGFAFEQLGSLGVVAQAHVQPQLRAQCVQLPCATRGVLVGNARGFEVRQSQRELAVRFEDARGICRRRRGCHLQRHAAKEQRQSCRHTSREETWHQHLELHGSLDFSESRRALRSQLHGPIPGASSIRRPERPDPHDPFHPR